MPSKRVGVISISSMFLLYAGVRAVVAGLVLLQLHGFIDFPELQKAVQDIESFLTDNAAAALVPFSASGYLYYLGLMGILLFVGALGFLRERHAAPAFVAAFLILYVGLFVNFQLINPKIWHLIICAALFAVLMWLRRGERSSLSASSSSLKSAVAQDLAQTQ